MRRSRRFLPGGWDTLEIRQVLSHAMAMAPTRGEIHIAVPGGSFAPLPARLTPVEGLDRGFASSREDVRTAGTVDAPGPSANDTDPPSSRSSPPQGVDDTAGAYPAYVRTRDQVMTANLATDSRPMPAKRPGWAQAPGTRGVLPRPIAMRASDRPTRAVPAIPPPSDPGPDVARDDPALDLAIEGVRTRPIVGVGPLSRKTTGAALRQAPPSKGPGS